MAALNELSVAMGPTDMYEYVATSFECYATRKARHIMHAGVTNVEDPTPQGLPL